MCRAFGSGRLTHDDRMHVVGRANLSPGVVDNKIKGLLGTIVIDIILKLALVKIDGAECHFWCGKFLSTVREKTWPYLVRTNAG